MDIQTIVEKYIALRDKKAAIKAEYDARIAKIDEVMDKVEAALLKHFDEVGIDAVKTGAGTAYTSVKTSATVADWDMYLSFVKAQEAWQLLERRVAKKAVEEYREVNGDLPPGVNWSEERVVNIRRGK